MAGWACFKIRCVCENARARDLEDGSGAIAAQHHRTLRRLIPEEKEISIGQRRLDSRGGHDY